MRRFFILGKYNTWYDWRLTVTAKSVPPAEPKTNYITLDGADGSLDLSEALTGEPVYNDRTLTASFMCSEGTHTERVALVSRITAALHGRRVQIVEPDDPDHYFLGRVKLKDVEHHLAYSTFNLEATTEPWRYAANESSRVVTVAEGDAPSVVIYNSGDKSLCPTIAVDGAVQITTGGTTVELGTGIHKIIDLRLRRGPNVVAVSGAGTVTFVYREASL